MKTFLISPVRGHDPAVWKKQVVQIEAFGWEVYWPHRDTDQSDDIGLSICRQNLEAIQRADAVHVIWDGKSQGCLFDLGMAFALGKKVFSISLPDPTEGKSFQNMVRAWSARSA